MIGSAFLSWSETSPLYRVKSSRFVSARIRVHVIRTLDFYHVFFLHRESGHLAIYHSLASGKNRMRDARKERNRSLAAREDARNTGIVLSSC